MRVSSKRRTAFPGASAGIALSLWLLSSHADAAGATRLSIGAELYGVFSPYTAGPAGTSASIVVIPVDDAGNPDYSWTGRISYSSSDVLATLPGVCTYPSGPCTNNDPFNFVFQTLGPQTLTVTDLARVLAPGTMTVDVR